MCIRCPLGGLDHAWRTHRASLEEPPHAVVSIHIYTTHLKSVSENTFLWCWAMNWQGWGPKFDGCFKQLCREMMATWRVFSSTLCHRFQRQPICQAHGWGWFRPRCKSRHVGFETCRAQFTSLQRCWTSGSCETQRFHRDTQRVTSSGSHAGKLWPLAISQTITSQPRLNLWASQRLQNKERGYLGNAKR